MAGTQPLSNSCPVQQVLQVEIMPHFPRELQATLGELPAGAQQRLTEIRLRRDRPLSVTLGSSQVFVTRRGELTPDFGEALIVEGDLFDRTVERMTQGSLYAMEAELRNGYITLAGGHRVGITGTGVVTEGRVRVLKHLSSLNVRIAREVRGAADRVMPLIWHQEHRLPYNTLVYSGPGAGKTTLLRDMARQLSTGDAAYDRPGLTVGVVDERSELAASYRGVPGHDLGPRSDVLDACPKAEGMVMMLRSMGPQVLVTDEIGRPDDAVAVHDARSGGVAVIASAHATTLAELRSRPVLSGLLAAGVFERLVCLSAVPTPGSLVAVSDGQGTQLFEGEGTRW